MPVKACWVLRLTGLRVGVQRVGLHLGVFAVRRRPLGEARWLGGSRRARLTQIMWEYAGRPNVIAAGGTRQTILCHSAWLPAASAPHSTRWPLSTQRPSCLMSV